MIYAIPTLCLGRLLHPLEPPEIYPFAVKVCWTFDWAK